MALDFYDQNQVLFAGPFNSHHDGHIGALHEEKLYVRNDAVLKYYTNVQISVLGALGTSGWSIKMMTGERQPTEAEWDSVTNGATLTMADIGSTAAADTATYHALWLRIYCPGGTSAQINENFSLQLDALEREVGG